MVDATSGRADHRIIERRRGRAGRGCPTVMGAIIKARPCGSVSSGLRGARAGIMDGRWKDWIEREEGGVRQMVMQSELG